MKIVFLGTPDYVVPILEVLHKEFRSRSGESPIAAVVTQKPKPVGREQQLEYSPVDTWAFKKKIPIFFDSKELVTQDIQADIAVLASYGELIPNEVINLFKYGILNVHPSLLPKYRGASPIQAAIISGDETTGVTFMDLDEKLDHGNIISQFKEDILDEDTTETLRTRLFTRSAEVLTTLIPAYMSGKIKPREQDHDKAILTRQIKKEDAFIQPKLVDLVMKGKSSKVKFEIPFIKDFTVQLSPNAIHNFIRAMQPWPQVWTLLRLNSSGQAVRLKILKAHVEEKPNVKNQKSKVLILDEVQLEGKNPVTWKQLLEGYPEATFK